MSKEEIQKIVTEFNMKHKPGTLGVLKKDGDGGLFETTVRWPATVMSGEAVVWLENVSGCYLLDRFTPNVNHEGRGD